jgi:hypothetical protein
VQRIRLPAAYAVCRVRRARQGTPGCSCRQELGRGADPAAVLRGLLSPLRGHRFEFFVGLACVEGWTRPGFSTPAFSCQNLSNSMNGPQLISTCFGSFEIECQEVLEHPLVRDVLRPAVGGKDSTRCGRTLPIRDVAVACLDFQRYTYASFHV